MRIEARTLYRVANDPNAINSLQPAVRDLLIDAVRANRPGDFRHEVKGVRNGQFNYAVKHGLHQFRINSTTAVSEHTEIKRI